MILLNLKGQCNAFGLYFSLLQFRQKLVSLLQCRRPIKVCQLMRYLVLLAENKGEIKLHYCSFGVGHFISYINNKKILNQRTITEIMLVCKHNLYPAMQCCLLYYASKWSQHTHKRTTAQQNNTANLAYDCDENKYTSNEYHASH